MSLNVKRIESFKKRIKKITQENINLIDVFIELRIILKILQKFDQLAQNVWLHVASTNSAKIEENSIKISTNWHLKNDVLCYQNRYYIFSSLLWRELLKQNHDDFQAKHFEFDRTTNLITRKYWWSNMI